MIYATFYRELLSNRNLVRELVRKELKTRYSRPFLGFLWVFLSPLFAVAVFYAVFSLFLQVRVREAPFVLYLMTAVFPWKFFQESLTASATGLVDNKNLIRESGFPHYLIPVSITLANLINLLPSLLILIAASAIMLGGLPLFIIFLPLVIFIQALAVTGISIFLSIVYVRWRDTRHVLEPLLLFLFYSIPGVYSLSLVKQVLTPVQFSVYAHNPLVGMVSLYRVVLLKDFYPYAAQAAGISALILGPALFALAVCWFSMHFYAKNRYWINDYLSY